MSLDATQFNAGLTQASGGFANFTKGLLKSAGIGSIGSLVTKSITTGLNAVSGGGNVSSSFGGFLKNTFSGVAGGAAAGGLVGGPIGAVAGGIGGGITSVIGEIGGAVSELADKFKLAKRSANELGISVESFQKLSFAAERMGVDTEGFTAAFAKFERNIDEAKGSAGEARDLFKGIGISVQDLESLSPDELFKKVAAGIRELPDPTQKVGEAIGLFGRSGATLLPAINNLEALTAKADELGIGSKKSNEALDAYNKALRDLNDQWTALKITVVTAVVPALTWLIEGLNTFFKKLKEWGDWIGITTPKIATDSGIKGFKQPETPKGSVAGGEGSVAGLSKARQLIGQNPADLFQEEIAALQKARKFGKGAINDDELAQGVFNAGSKLIKSLGTVSNEIPALFKDSKEATEAIIRSQDPDRGNFADRLLQAIEAQKQIQIQQRDLGRDANSKLAQIAEQKGLELKL